LKSFLECMIKFIHCAESSMREEEQFQPIFCLQIYWTTIEIEPKMNSLLPKFDFLDKIKEQKISQHRYISMVLS
jgi:hypothetical protein